MISEVNLQKLAVQKQTTLFPNLLREYFQHLFLCELYRIPGANEILFKGGTALRIIYGSPRFSEDLDFSVNKIRPDELKKSVETLFVKTLSAIEKEGIIVKIDGKSGATSGGYWGAANFVTNSFKPIGIEINVSSRKNRALHGEVDSIVSDFVPTYNIFHLVQEELVEEKIFGALMDRKKPRDFYDLYFIMRSGLLVTSQKNRLKKIKDEIVASAKKISFRSELSMFLPINQQTIIKDFPRILEAELSRQIV